MARKFYNITRKVSEPKTAEEELRRDNGKSQRHSEKSYVNKVNKYDRNKDSGSDKKCEQSYKKKEARELKGGEQR